MSATDKKLPQSTAVAVPAEWPVTKLKPYARNARTHPEEQILRLMASIREFGLVGAIVVRDGVIGKGHGTMQAVMRLYAGGEAIYPAPGQKGGAQPYQAQHVPVLDVSGWTEAQFRAYVIADNRIAEDAGWDESLLRVELADLRAIGFDTELTGFEDDELAEVMGKTSGVRSVDVHSVQDRFWISVRGPLKSQALALAALRTAMTGIEGVDVQIATVTQEKYEP